MKPSKLQLTHLFACPQCKTPLFPIKLKSKCLRCGFRYWKSGGIWHFLKTGDARTQTSAIHYDAIHKKSFIGPDDGSYEILGSFARGNRAVDIACGDGRIETLAPETVGVEFSLNALKNAISRGVKHLVHADAQALPFTDNSFDVAICAGSLEHFVDPQSAVNEMARVASIQILTVHKKLPFPLSLGERVLTNLGRVTHQPIERPFSRQALMGLLRKAGLHTVFEGVWTLPVNYGKAVSYLPQLSGLPSCHFVVSIKRK